MKLLEKMRFRRTAGSYELIGHIGVDNDEIMVVDLVCESPVAGEGEVQLRLECVGVGDRPAAVGDEYFPVFAEVDEDGHWRRFIIEVGATGFDEPRLG